MVIAVRVVDIGFTIMVIQVDAYVGLGVVINVQNVRTVTVLVIPSYVYAVLVVDMLKVRRYAR